MLPVLAALPEIEVASGTAPAFTLAQITEAVEQAMGEGGGRFRRKVSVAARAALVKAAVERHHSRRPWPPARRPITRG